MAYDRFVYWKDTVPTKEQIGEVLHDFLGELATSVEWKDDRWYVSLLGALTGMFRRQPGAYAFDYGDRQRGFEVWVRDRGRAPCIDVITRMADDATTALANDFAHRCAKFWGGTEDEE